MPRVPYQPYSDVGPSGQNISAAEATPQAFGAGVGRSISGIGSELEQAGDRVYNRALAFQNLDNRNEADRLMSQFTEAADLERVDYQSKEGNNSKEALLPYYQRISDLRESFRKQASNAKVENLFNGESRGLEVRLKTSGATHAAAEFKKYQGQVSAANIKSIQDQVMMFPNDDILFEQSIQKLQGVIAGDAELHGLSKEVADQNFYDARSALTAARTAAMAKKDAKAGEAMFQKYTANGFIRGEKIGPTEERVRHQMNTVGAKVAATGLVSGASTDLGSGIIPISQAKMAIAAMETGGIKEPYSHIDVQTPQGRALGKYGFMSKLLPEFLHEAGMAPMTSEQFLASKEAQDELFEKRFGSLMQKHGSFNEAAKRWIGLGKKGDYYGTTADVYVQKANGHLARGATLEQLRAKGQEVAQRDSTDPMFAEGVDQAVITQFNRNRAAERDTQYRVADTLRGLASGVDMPNGKKPTTIEEITAVPSGEDAWFKADNKTKDFILNKVLPHNARGDHTFTEATYRDYAKLVGMANSPDAEDRKAFLETPMEEFMAKPWPFAKRDAIINLQRKMQNQIEGNPHVTAGLAAIAPMMNGIVDKKVDKDDWYSFVGTFHDMILNAQQQNQGKPLKDEDYQKIGRIMLYQKMEKGWFGSDVPGEPAYRIKPSEEAAQRIKEDRSIWTIDGQYRPPSDEMVNRYYRFMILSASPVVTKPATKEPTKPPPPSITDRLVGAIDLYAERMRAQEKAATEAAAEAAVNEAVAKPPKALEPPELILPTGKVMKAKQ